VTKALSDRPGARRAERRLLPRIEVTGRLLGRIVPAAITIEVRDVGPGGFSITAPVPFPPGVRHPFQFTLGDGSTIAVDAVSEHAMPLGEPPVRLVMWFLL
jgi:hypothetical protein